MSTLATADLSSDDEDADFVPDQPKKRSTKAKGAGTKRPRAGSSTSDSDDSDLDEGDIEHDEAKRLRLDQEAVEAEERRWKAAEAFAALRDEVSSSSAKKDIPESEAGKGEVQMVEVKRPRQFAGETIFETVSLPATDPEATRYLTDQKKTADNASSNITKLDSNSTSLPTGAPTTAGRGSQIPQASSSTSTQAPTATPPISSGQLGSTSSTRNTAIQPSLRKGPPKRKPRQSLESMAGALAKGKKMTTLEKSQMDWKSHTTSDQHIQDELDRNRRSGGYLDKREFLDRVDERRSGAYDSAKR